MKACLCVATLLFIQLHDLLASKYLMSPYKNMNWLLKIAYN